MEGRTSPRGSSGTGMNGWAKAEERERRRTGETGLQKEEGIGGIRNERSTRIVTLQGK